MVTTRSKSAVVITSLAVVQLALLSCATLAESPQSSAMSDAPADRAVLARPTMTDNERAWSEWLAQELSAKAEYRTEDGSRVDVLTDTHAIEVEWIKKQSGAHGQALLYAAATNRKPAIVLLKRGKPNEDKYFLRCVSAALLASIPVFVIDCRANAAGKNQWTIEQIGMLR